MSTNQQIAVIVMFQVVFQVVLLSILIGLLTQSQSQNRVTALPSGTQQQTTVGVLCRGQEVDVTSSSLRVLLREEPLSNPCG